MRGDGLTTGTLSVTNRLVISDISGSTGIFPLKNGDYVVCDTYNLRSAAIWGSGTTVDVVLVKAGGVVVTLYLS